jgi:hypothetical protein
VFALHKWNSNEAETTRTREQEEAHNEHLLCLMIALQIIESTIAVAAAVGSGEQVLIFRLMPLTQLCCYLQIY